MTIIEMSSYKIAETPIPPNLDSSSDVNSLLALVEAHNNMAEEKVIRPIDQHIDV